MLTGVGLLAASLGIAAPAEAARPEPAAPLAVVTIRAARFVDMSATASRAAYEIVRAIFRETGIETLWRECPTHHAGDAGPSDRCEDPLSLTEVVVRFVSAPPTAPLESLGFSYASDGAGIGRLASVYPDRVARYAERAALSLPALLGRVIAHEVGHLLLGTRHSREGLMRARWSSLDLARQRSRRSWRFSLEEAAAMRRALRELGADARAL